MICARRGHDRRARGLQRRGHVTGRQPSCCDASCNRRALRPDDRTLVEAEEGVGEGIAAIIGPAAVREQVAPEDAARLARSHIVLLELELDVNCLCHREERERDSPGLSSQEG